AAPPREQRVGPYRVLHEIGRGGQATVYLAEDTRLPRRVALKVLAGGFALSDPMLQRFRREAQAASRLDHPGICTVFDADVDGDTPYIAMRYVEGGSLAQHIETCRAAAGLDSSSRAPTPVRLPPARGA